MRSFQYAFAAMLPLLLPNVPQQSKPAITGQPEAYTLRTNAKLVVLDVVVTDKNGTPVTNLKKEDFEVQEDKQPQRIYSFEAPAAHALPPNVTIHSTAELDRLAPNAATTILVLDEYTSGFAYIYTARNAIQQYLKAQPQQLPQPTMLIAVNADRMIVLRDYTQDKDALLTALSHHNSGPADRSGSQARNGLGFLSSQVLTGFRSLEQLAQSTAGHPGHKNVIWAGGGLPKLDMSGPTAVSPAVALQLHTELQKLMDMLIASRITVSTLDLKGVQWADILRGGTINGVDDSPVSFAEVAIATGGTRIFQRNDIDAAIASVVQNNSNFYTLSYVPTSGSDATGAFRRIRIVLKDPNLRATTRTGYYPHSEKEPGWQLGAGKPAPPSASKSIDKTLVDTNMVFDGIPITLQRGSTPGKVVVQMAAAALPWTDHGPGQAPTASIQVSCVSFDAKGKVLTHEGSDTQIISPENGSDGAHKTEVGLSLTFTPDPRAVSLRVVVQAPDTGKIGAANLDLTAR